jgi:dihydroorotate dehydrogenase (NAD+) catalytic subunit
MVKREAEFRGINPSGEGAFQPDLSVEVAGIRMKNPVMTASGTFGYAKEFEPYFDLNRLGAIVVKTITLKPRAGNPPPRIVETPAGMLNAIGLQNAGLEAFLEHHLPYLRQFSPPLIVNIAGGAIEEYEVLASRLSQAEGVAGLEVNVSCPNLADGLVFGTDAGLLFSLVEHVRKVTHLPLLVKLTPNVTDIALMARSAVEAGADGLSLINTLLGMAINLETRRPKLANVTGGLSGPAIKPVALRMVYRAAQAVKVPIVGIGGIMAAEDALEFLIAGAQAVAVGTANFVDPTACIQIIEGIEAYVQRHRVPRLQDLIGTLSTEAG